MDTKTSGILNKGQGMKNIWVERLSILDLPYIILLEFPGASKVYYDENRITKWARIFLALAQRAGLFRNFYPAQLSLEKKDSAGGALLYLLEENLAVLAEDICSRELPNLSLDLKAVLSSYIVFYLYPQVTFITMVERAPAFQKNKSKNILYFASHPLNPALVSFYKKKGYILREGLLSLKSIKYYAVPFFHLAAVALLKFIPRKIRTNLLQVRPAIWVEYAHNDVADQAFWSAHINRNDFDIVYYLDRRDPFPLEVMTTAIEGRGFKWLDLNFSSLVKLSNLGLRDLRGLLRAGILSLKPVPLWFRVFNFEYKFWFLLYRSVFRRFKVKVLIQHQEAFWRQAPQAKAMEASGGIMLGFNWTSYPFSKAVGFLHPQHVFFVWGKVIQECIQARTAYRGQILPSGMWLIPNGSKRKDLERFAQDLSFVMAVFDSSVGYNIYQSPQSLSKFYLGILGLVEVNPRWGGIIKSKNFTLADLEQLPHGQEIVSKINSLISHKKLVVLEPPTSPGVAAQYAHLSVCYGINSAGIVCGVLGHRVVHWDCSGFLHHPLYKDKDQQFIYLDFDKFKEAIIEVSKGNKKIGDFSRWRKNFNYFSDSLASWRVGNFIQSFMDKAVNREDREYALGNTLREYKEKNRLEDSFFELENFWEEEYVG